MIFASPEIENEDWKEWKSFRIRAISLLVIWHVPLHLRLKICLVWSHKGIHAQLSMKLYILRDVFSLISLKTKVIFFWCFAFICRHQSSPQFPKEVHFVHNLHNFYFCQQRETTCEINLLCHAKKVWPLIRAFQQVLYFHHNLAFYANHSVILLSAKSPTDKRVVCKM